MDLLISAQFGLTFFPFFWVKYNHNFFWGSNWLLCFFFLLVFLGFVCKLKERLGRMTKLIEEVEIFFPRIVKKVGVWNYKVFRFFFSS